MPDFDQMTLQELIRPEGFDCDCGKHHACAMDFLEIGPGAVAKAPDMVRAMGWQGPSSCAIKTPTKPRESGWTSC
ncbi:MAG: hypothetical protein IJP78_04865 [Clostridia bacterium]|nr:hypothetical protein [Clostridia bacterium]